MKKTFFIIIIFSMAISGCQQPDETAANKEKLKKLKEKSKELNTKIATLEKEIQKADSSWSAEDEKGTLVKTINLQPTIFDHYIEVQGTAESKENILISAEMVGAAMKILVNEGDEILKGQHLIKLDDQVLQKNLADLQTSLDLAVIIFQKQENLWNQKIGSEIQFLQAKSNKESLEKKVEMLRAQIKKTDITSPINGTIDELFIKKGEMAGPGSPLVRVVNLGSVYVEADVSEAYIEAFFKGDTSLVSYPSLNKNQKGIITSVGQFINPMNRTFKIEITLFGKNTMLKPNLLTIVKIKDYQKIGAIAIPTKYIHHSLDHDYVYLVKNESGKTTAQKEIIEMGRSYNGQTEVLSGLKVANELITEGTTDIIDGERITVVN